MLGLGGFARVFGYKHIGMGNAYLQDPTRMALRSSGMSICMCVDLNTFNYKTLGLEIFFANIFLQLMTLQYVKKPIRE